MEQNNSKMKRKAIHDCYYYGEDFTLKEYEACEALLSLRTALFQVEEGSTSGKLKKTGDGGKKRSSKRRRMTRSSSNNNNNNNHPSTQNLNNNNNELYVPPDLPPVQALDGLIMGCSRPFEKQLKDSDLRENQNRLFLNKGHVETHLLPLLMEGEDVKEGISVIAYDVDGRMFSMTFKLWADKYYVLTGGWNSFFQTHALQMLRDYVTVWMFRHSQTNNLCFALSIRRQE